MVLWVAAVVIAGMMLAVWAISVAVRDAGIVDILWGFGFVVVAWVSWLVTDGHDVRAALLVFMATAWGLRLAIHLAFRNIGQEEDFRYQSMRRRAGDRFWITSLVRVFGLQAAAMWVMSLPLMIGISDADRGFSPLWVIGTAVFLVGFGFEAVSDWQLTQFKADSGNAGTVMDRGLWRYSRHPNYFGDCVVWWGIYLAAAAAGAWWTIAGPLVMTVLLLRVSGVALLERSIGKRRPGYAEYSARTSAFIPMPPRRAPR